MLEMEEKEEFYIGYLDEVGEKTKKTLKRFVFAALGLLLVCGFLFSFFQNPAVNSSFDFNNPAKVSGVYHESPYPMLRVKLADDVYKDILLLGFGKFGPNKYLKEIKKETSSLVGKGLTIEGQLIYYNGKTLLEIDDSQKITLSNSKMQPITAATQLDTKELEGEIVDPKCYFGVMKPGYGKIHRSCAALCISGGMPPVLVSLNEIGIEEYFLLTNLKGNPIHQDILPYIGQPSMLKGKVFDLGDWKEMRIDVAQIRKLNRESSIY